MNSGETTIKTIYNKLVRDKIPSRLDSLKVPYKIHVASGREYQEKLLKKLVEEAEEVVKAKDKGEKMKELADLLEVIEALLSSLKATKKQVEKIQKETRKERGSFKKKIILEWS